MCASDAECDDGQFCTGVEVCDPAAPGAGEDGCASGAAPSVDDGIVCTQDICDESADQVVHIAAACECPNGTKEECQILLAAERNVTLPELEGLCVDTECNAQLQCDGINKRVGATCDDGVSCTRGDACDGGGECVAGAPDDAACEDGQFCNGAEVCDAGRGCLPGDPLQIDDGVLCTADSCDEQRDVIVNDDGPCGCEEDQDCEPEQGANTCLRYFCLDRVCGSEPLPRAAVCNDGLSCTNGDTCDGEGTCSGAPVDRLCDDGAFCNGVEFCDPESERRDANGCIAGTPPPVNDGVECTDDSCNEQQDRVINDPSSCPCLQDRDCVPEQNPNPCLEYTCTPAQLCMIATRPNGSACDDGIACTGQDECQTGSCNGVSNDSLCLDDLFCNGTEICQPGHPEANAEGCRAQNVPVLDDEIACTVDACDEQGQRVTHTANNAACADQSFCDGDEICDLGLGCVEGTPRVLSDEIACTQDRCDEQNDRVINEPLNANCDDGLFCTGAETCVPDDDNADADGCVAGLDPQINDDIPCTDDVCDEDANVVRNTPNNAPCADSLFCNGVELCDPLNDNADANGCVAGPPADPNDDVNCTTDDCNEATDSFVNVPVNALCSDRLFCNGEETCEPNNPDRDADGCFRGPDPIERHPDQRECVVHACNEGNDTVSANTSACAPVCQNDAECTARLTPADVCRTTACNPAGQGADDFGCIVSARPDTTACALTCPGANPSGQCLAGACIVPAEGPTGNSGCADALDNDCDGAADGVDSDCRTPDLLEISAPATGSGGLAGTGAVLQVTPRDGGDPVTSQTANLYCTSRIVAQESTFNEARAAFAARSDVQILNAAGQLAPQSTSVDTNVAFEGDGDTRGLEICDGHSVILGPYNLPSLNTPAIYGVVLVVDMGFEANGLGLGQYLVASYRNGGTQNKYVPLVASGGGEVSGLTTFRFSLYNASNFQPIFLRFDLVGADLDGACGFVNEARLEESPRIEFGSTDRVIPLWTFGSTTEAAVQRFQGSFQASTFFTTLTLGLGDHVIETTTASNNNGNPNGAEWGFTGLGVGGLQLPPVESFDPSTANRANPVVLDFRATSEGTTLALNEVAHAAMLIGDDLLTTRKVASIFPRGTNGPAHFISHYDLGATTTHNRYTVLLPEEAKPLLGRTFGFVTSGMIGGTKRIWLDDLNIYFHTRATLVDMNQTGLGPVAANSPTHQIRLRHAERASRQANVQCFWQIPGDPDAPTISSDPVRITFD